MDTYACGIDFGTSNSSIAIASANAVRLVPVEGNSVTLPSAIFFRQRDNKPFYGRAAIELVILTGGTTEIPAIQAEFNRLFPAATLSDSHKLSSVGLGLAYDSRRRFGSNVPVSVTRQ